VQLLSHLALDSTLGWRDFTKTDVRVHEIPGDHDSITGEPMVRQLAKILSADLNADLGTSTSRLDASATRAINRFD
jgi:thioesterase domain-containing protein